MISKRLRGTMMASLFFASTRAPNSPDQFELIAFLQLYVLRDPRLRVSNGRSGGLDREHCI